MTPGNAPVAPAWTASDGAASLSFTHLAVTNGTWYYYVLSATNLAQPRSTWLPVWTNIVGSEGRSTNTVSTTGGDRQRYYLLSIPYN